ncbi:MAG: hypothetical protein PHE17_17320 [Thiothrix sp.]|uniref:hypothetical protein n=1 Tax=Thiothrix sp. TaxID=1032 RepID=UPI002634858F|nr:hypothetical protein [Thiothrix sp.]MDD5394780.1 hypothetical protein [Thiothrix sp.]
MKINVETTNAAPIERVRGFDAEQTHSIEQQQGWQAILNNFKRHVEAKEEYHA